MFDRLKKRLGIPDRLSRLARAGDPVKFARAMGTTNVCVIAALQSEGLDPTTATPDEMLAEIGRSAKDLSERQEGFDPMVYEADGVRRLPFFSSQKHAETFAGDYSKERDRMYPFQLLFVRGSVLTGLLPLSDHFVLNDRSHDAYTLTPADRAALLHAWGGERGLDE